MLAKIPRVAINACYKEICVCVHVAYAHMDFCVHNNYVHGHRQI